MSDAVNGRLAVFDAAGTFLRSVALTGAAIPFGLFDLAVAVSASAQADALFVSRLYRDIFNSTPDPAGVANWVAQLGAGTITRAQVAQAFFLDPRSQTNAMFLAKCHLGVLQRDTDAAGWQSILNLMSRGATQAATLGGFLSTSEAQAIWGSPSCVSGATGCTSDAAFVNSLYLKLLGRAPDPAGLAYWDFLLRLGVLSRGDVIMDFIQSPEFSAKHLARADANMLYLAFLRRAGELGGVNYWTVVFNFGVPLVDVIQGFITSPEYLARP